MTALVTICTLALAGIAGITMLAWWEYRRGVRFFADFWSRADARVERVQRSLETLPDRAREAGSDLFHAGLHVAAIFLHRLSVKGREVAHHLSARTRARRQNGNGPTSAFLKHVTEHKRGLASRRDEREE